VLAFTSRRALTAPRKPIQAFVGKKAKPSPAKRRKPAKTKKGMVQNGLNPPSFKLLLAQSIGVAILGLSVPPLAILSGGITAVEWYVAVATCSLICLVALLAGLRFYGARGAWLVVPLVVSLYWISPTLAILLVCSTTGRCF
jgi:hypothetical protein